MAGDTANPRIWVNADVYDAPVGTTAPVDVTTAWAAAWKPLGLLSEDGMTESREDEVTDHYAYGGILVRTTKSKHKRSIVVTALEDNPVVWGLVNPGSTATTSAGPTPPAGVTTRIIKVPTPNPRAFGLHLVDGTVIKRRVIPRGEVIAVGETSITDNEMAMYELTINIYPDATGVLYRDITNDAQATVV